MKSLNILTAINVISDAIRSISMFLYQIVGSDCRSITHPKTENWENNIGQSIGKISVQSMSNITPRNIRQPYHQKSLFFVDIFLKSFKVYFIIILIFTANTLTFFSNSNYIALPKV